ncbi:MAG: D-alanyl-D-alanine carboxypeptidase family protein [Clostridia bacterium]
MMSILFSFVPFVAISDTVFANDVLPKINNSLTIETRAKSAVVIEAQTGRVLFEKNKDQKLAMASTTKIVTALTVLNHCKNLKQKVKINDKAVGVEGTSLYLKKGEILTVKELLYGVMLPSGNDASLALAIHVAGSESKFCEMMEQTAKTVGANNSCFKNSHGLDAVGHYTTAHDLAKITAKALENKVFMEIVCTEYIKINGVSPDNARLLKNKNKLLGKFEGCNGVKTGFTDNAGRCFVSSAERNGLKLVCVVLNCVDMFNDSEALLENTFKNYTMHQVLLPYAFQKKVIVENGKKANVKIFSKRGFAYPILTKEVSKFEVVVDLPQTLYAPLKKEQEVGEIKIYFDNHLLFCEKLFTMDEIRSINFWDNLKEIYDRWSFFGENKQVFG